MSSEPAVQPDEFEALFLQSARRVTSGDGAFTLHGLAPSTPMFSDRPERRFCTILAGEEPQVVVWAGCGPRPIVSIASAAAAGPPAAA